MKRGKRGESERIDKERGREGDKRRVRKKEN